MCCENLTFLFDNSSTTSNGVVSAGERAATKAIALFIALIAIAGAVSNILILLAFIANRKLRTSFNFYILNLTLANLFSSVVQVPLSTHYTFLQGSTWSYQACTLFMYCDCMSGAANVNAVACMALNRIYSSFWYKGFRQRQSDTSAIISCIVMWLYLNVIVIPFVLVERLYGSSQVSTVCLTGFTNSTFALSLEVTLFVAPVGVVLLGYVIISWKISGRKQPLRPRIAPQYRDVLRGENPDSPQASVANSPPATACPTAVVVALTMTRFLRPTHAPSQLKQEWRWSKTFLALATALLLGWMPVSVFYTLIILQPSSFRFVAYALVTSIRYVTLITNPVVYYCTMPAVKGTLREMCSRVRAEMGGIQSVESAASK